MRLTGAHELRLDISEEALAQLHALPREQRRRIGQRLAALQHDLQGDVKKLSGQVGKYRLRVAITGFCSRWKRTSSSLSW